MAVLTRRERKVIGSPWLEEVFVKSRKVGNLSFTDIEAAIQSTEDWIEANQGGFEISLPEPFKSKTTSQEKHLLLAYSVMKRVGLI